MSGFAVFVGALWGLAVILGGVAYMDYRGKVTAERAVIRRQMKMIVSIVAMALVVGGMILWLLLRTGG